MKEMYVKPMVEKIIFDNVNIITTSVASVVVATAGDTCDTVVNNTGYDNKKNSGTCDCYINNHNLNQCPI